MGVTRSNITVFFFGGNESTKKNFVGSFGGRYFVEKALSCPRLNPVGLMSLCLICSMDQCHQASTGNFLSTNRCCMFVVVVFIDVGTEFLLISDSLSMHVVTSGPDMALQ